VGQTLVERQLLWSAATVFFPRKWSVKRAIGASPRLKRRSSQSFFSASGIDA